MNSMIKIYMKICCMALCMVGLSFQVLNAQECASSFSQDWTGDMTTYSSNLGIATVTFDSPDAAGSNTTTFTPNGTFFSMDMGWWTPGSLAGAQSLQYTLNWDDTPDLSGDASDDGATKTITITYSQPVTNPVVHIDRLGGNFAADGVNQDYISNSTMWTLTTPGITINRVSGNPQFIVNGNAFYREPNVNLGSPNNPIGGEADGNNGMNGTAAGTLMFMGTVTTLTFDVVGVGPDGLGAIDGIEMIFEADLGPMASFTVDPAESCEGLDVAVANTSVFDPNGNVTFSWIYDYPGDVSSTDQDPMSISYATGGSYTIALILDDGTCQDTVMQSVTLSAADDPTASFDVETSGCSDDVNVTITSTSTSDVGIDSYAYTVESLDGATSFTGDEAVLAFNDEAGGFNVTLTVTNANGCTSSVTQLVGVTGDVFNYDIEDIASCEGSVVSLGTFEDGTSFTFDPDNITIENNELTVAVGADAVTYTYTATDGNCSTSGMFTVSGDGGGMTPFEVAAEATLCVGGSATLASDLPDGWTVTSDPDGVVTVVDNSLVAIGVNESTMVNLSFMDPSGCEYSATSSITVATAPLTGLPASVDICTDGTGSVSVSAVDYPTVQWVADGDVVIVTSGYTAVFESGPDGGSITLNATSADGCEISQVVLVNGNSGPGVALPPSVSLCGDEEGMLSLDGTSGNTYDWSSMGDITITSATDGNMVTFTSGAMGGQIFVNCTSAAGCVSTASVEVGLGNTPDVTFPDPLYACEGQPLTIPTDPNYTYVFTKSGSGTIDGNVFTFPAATTGSGISDVVICPVTVEITPVDCGTVGGSWSETAADTYYNADAGIEFISGSAAGTIATTFTPNGTFNTTNNGYWTNSDATGGQSLEFTINWDDTPDGTDQASDDSAIQSVTINFDSPQTNPIIHIDRLGGNFRGAGESDFISNSTMWTLTTAGASVMRLSGNPQFVVNGNAFYREPNVALGPNAPGGEVDGTNGMNGTAAGTIQIIGTVSTLDFEVVGVGIDGDNAIDGIEMIFESGGADCCPVTTTFDIVVNPDPLNPVNSPVSQCEGDSVTLNAGAADGYTYSWTSNPFYQFTDTNLATQEVSVTQTTSFFVTATATDGSGCEYTAQIDVMYNAAPDVMTETETIEVCPGGEEVVSFETDATEVWCYYEYFVTTGSGTMSVISFTGSGAVMDGMYNMPFVDTGSGSGNLIKEFYSADGCVSEYIIPVTVLDAEVYINADADNPMGVQTIFYCPGDEVTLTASSDQGVMSVTWFDANDEEKSTANPYTFVPTEGGVCTVEAILDNGCVAVNTVTLVPIDLMVDLTSSTGEVYCEGEQVTLTATTDPEGLVVTWVCDDDTTGTGDELTFTPEGTVTCTATVMDMGCEDSQSITLTPEVASIAVEPGDAVICPGECVDLTATVGDDCESTLWSTNETTPGITVCPDQTTEYTVTCTTPDGCEATASVIVTVEDAPQVDASASPEVIDQGDSSTLSVTNPDDDCTYTWTVLGSEEVIGTGPTLDVSPNETTTYEVTCTTVDGCTSMAQVTVTVEEEPTVECSEDAIYIPNTFTPNSDGTNEQYILYSEDDILEVEFLIYDRWGEQVYKGDNMSDFWDGTYEGEQLSPDVYGYCVRWTCPGDDDVEFLKTGNITLIR